MIRTRFAAPFRRAVHIACAVVVVGLAPTPVAVAQEGDANRASSCSGIAFIDRDADGDLMEADDLDAIRNDPEPALPGVVVTMHDRRGNERIATTGDDGVWRIAATAADFPVRLHFELPDGLAPSSVGPDGGAQTQFIDSLADCGTGPVGSIGAYDPDHFCSERPEVVTSCFVVGNADGHDDMTAILAVADHVTDSGAADATSAADWMDPIYRPIATVGEVGSVYGQAVAADGTVYAAAFVKRHARLTTATNPAGNPTAIYRIPPGGDAELLTLVDRTAPDPHGGLDSGDYGEDFDAFDDVFTSGLGDLELSADGERLYVVDLGRRLLVELDPDDGTQHDAIELDGPTLGLSTCAVDGDDPFGDLRPFGLGWSADDELLVGVVCTAESTVAPDDLPVADTPDGRGAGDHAALVGYVYEMEDGAFVQRLAWPLAGDRGQTQRRSDLSNDATWHPWVSAGPLPVEHDAVSYPQPAVTDIAIGPGGTMVVAIGDRWGHQSGPSTTMRNAAGEELEINEAIPAGDIQRACPDGDGWVIEGTAGCEGGLGNGFEFFDGDSYGWHAETALGSVARPPGRSYVVAAHMDPFQNSTAWRSGGLVWHSVERGEALKGVRLYDGRDALPDETFEKAAGIGDVAIACGRAPVELGGSIWYDADGDAVRTPLERVIGDVAVTLSRPDGQVLATTIADESGRYLFDDDNVEDGLVDGAAYVVSIARSNFELDGELGPLSQRPGLRPTPLAGPPSSLRTGARAVAASDTVVGEAETPFAGLASITTVAGDDPDTAVVEGAIDHSLDFGLTDQYDIAVTTTAFEVRLDTGRLTYNVVVRNQGSEPSGALTITDRIPDGTSLVSVGGGGVEVEPGIVTWEIRSGEALGPGAHRRFQVVVQIDDMAYTPFVNAVEISADDGDDDDSAPDDDLIGETSDAVIERFSASEEIVDDNLARPDEDDHDVATVDIHEAGGRLWFDDDRSGTFEEDEEQHVGGGIVVQLIDENGIVVGSTTTDDDGRYVFSYRHAGRYWVEIPASQFDGGPLGSQDEVTGPGIDETMTDVGPDGARSRMFVLDDDGPTGEIPPSPSFAPDPRSDLTIHLGLWRADQPSIVRIVLVAVFAVCGVVTLAWLLRARLRNARAT